MLCFIRLHYRYPDGSEKQHDYYIKAKTLKIGSQQGHELCFYDADIGATHACIKLTKRRVTFQYLAEAHESQEVQLGDELPLCKGLSLKRINPPPAYHFAFEIHRDIAITGWPLPSYLENKQTHLQQLNISKARWSARMTMIILMIFLCLPLLSFNLLKTAAEKSLNQPPFSPQQRSQPKYFTPSFDVLWSTGPLHRAHRFSAGHCSDCHLALFTPVSNKTCLTCHQQLRHHLAAHMRNLSAYESASCTLCHKEHNEPGTLINEHSDFCVQCHGTVEALSSFSNTSLSEHKERDDYAPQIIASLSQHPAFYAEQQTASLHFSHRQHLNEMGIKTPKGRTVLHCNDCHSGQSTGDEHLQPLSFSEHCHSCHNMTLKIKGKKYPLEHGELTQVIRSLQQAIPAASEQYLQQRLMTDKYCLQCHMKNAEQELQVNHLQHPRSATQRFSHKRHELTQCQVCHVKTEDAEDSSKSLLPDKQTCLSCHDDSAKSNKIGLSCSSCHRFHNPEYQPRYETDVLNKTWSAAKGE
ncbi:MAG: hypothetical protein HRU20_24900 [Pseudomonadales bacterium]|nr:hypothetical protein [Pseudomonadales bacterium]